MNASRSSGGCSMSTIFYITIPRPRHIDQSSPEVVEFKKKAAATPGCHEGALRT
jgi:hypothetical protein